MGSVPTVVPTRRSPKRPERYLEAGYRTVIDLDLAKFFDRSSSHQRLLDRMSQRVTRPTRPRPRAPDAESRRGDAERHTRRRRGRNPAGSGPLSPILSNIVLDEFDQELARRGLRFVRYADDANVFVRSERAGMRVMASLRRFLEQRLRLQINEEKSAVRRPEQVHFLGFRFLCHRSTRHRRNWCDAVRQGEASGDDDHTGTNAAQLGPVDYVLYGGAQPLPERMDGTLPAMHVGSGARTWGDRCPCSSSAQGRSSCARGSDHASSTGICVPARSAGRRPQGQRIAARGVWPKSNRPGMTKAYPPAWFRERMVSLKTRWSELNTPRATDQLTLAL